MASILITGTNRGIGLELTRQFAQEGWRVHACYRNPLESEELQTLSHQFPQLCLYRLDVADSGQMSELAAELEEKTIDILLNNAGVFGPRPSNLEVRDVEGWLETYRINSIAPMQMALTFTKMLTRSSNPVLATIGSAMGSINENSSGGDYAYRASKTAVNMIMKGLSIDLAPQKISCVVLHPGWVHTRMGGTQAPLSPMDSAAGLKKVLLGLSYKDNGKFYDYCGQERPW